ncbi:ABC transporter substrate-binding protein [Deltaproteobacteria bacterium TL4]
MNEKNRNLTIVFFKKTSLLLIFTLMLLGLCSKSGVAAPSRQLVVGIESKPQTLDPRFAVDVEGMRITQQLIYETLVQQDYQLKIVPALAERWEIPTPTTYVFYLKPGVTFHNGKPLTAQDVKNSFEQVMLKETGSPFQFIQEKIKGISVVDEHTVRFELHAPQASFLLDSFIPVFQGQGPDFSGTGPFILSENTPSQIVLKRNPHYHEGAPFLEEVVFKVIQDDTTRFLKIQKGTLDLVINAVPLMKLEQFKKGKLSETYRVVEEPGLSYQYLGFNMEHPILKNQKVREAIAHAINLQELIVHFKKNHASIADSLLTPQNEYYAKDLPAYDYNPQKAAELLEQAGYPVKGGKRFSLEYKTTTKQDVITQARIIQNQLQQVGIEISIRSFEWGTFFADIKSGNFDLFSLRWVGVSEPDFYYAAFHSSQIPPAGRNRVRFSNTEIDHLVEQGSVEMNLEKRQSLYFKVQHLLAVELPYLSLWYNNNIAIVRNDLSGFRLHPTGGYHSFKSVQRK